MDNEVFSAFKKIEKQIEKQKKEEKRIEQARIRREEYERVQRELAKTKRRQLIVVYSGLFCFLVFMIYLISLAGEKTSSEEKSMTNWAGSVMEKVMNKDEDVLNCNRSENWRKKECVDRRKAETDRQWKSISVSGEANDKAFPINRYEE